MGSGRGHGHADADDGDNDKVTWALRVAIGVVFVILVMSGSSFMDGRAGHNSGVVRPLQGKRFRGGGQTDANFIGAVIDGTEVMVEKESAFLARHLDETLEVRLRVPLVRARGVAATHLARSYASSGADHAGSECAEFGFRLVVAQSQAMSCMDETRPQRLAPPPPQTPLPP